LNFSLQIKYKSKAEKMKNDYTVVMDTPVYVQNVLSGLNSSEVSICVTFQPQDCRCHYLKSSRNVTFNIFLVISF